MGKVLYLVVCRGGDLSFSITCLVRSVHVLVKRPKNIIPCMLFYLSEMRDNVIIYDSDASTNDFNVYSAAG